MALISASICATLEVEATDLFSYSNRSSSHGWLIMVNWLDDPYIKDLDTYPGRFVGGRGVNLRSSSDNWYSEVEAAVVFVNSEPCLGSRLTAVLGLSKAKSASKEIRKAPKHVHSCLNSKVIRRRRTRAIRSRTRSG